MGWFSTPKCPIHGIEYKIAEDYIPYIDIQRIGNSKSDLKLVKNLRRIGLKPY